MDTSAVGMGERVILMMVACMFARQGCVGGAQTGGVELAPCKAHPSHHTNAPPFHHILQQPRALPLHTTPPHPTS
eukprot:3935888-Rhodomonas_salina.1